MEVYLKPYKKKKVKSVVRLAKPFKRPKKLEFAYDAGDDKDIDNKHYLVVNWKLPDTSDAVLNFSLRILGHILIGTPVSDRERLCLIWVWAKIWQALAWKQNCGISFSQRDLKAR